MAKYCPNCGTEVADNALNCTTCGVAFVQQAAPQQTYAQPAQAVPGAKSKMCAGLLGIFLGCFGVHNFYLGYTGKAVAQLLISVLSCFSLSFVSGIWGLIEGIMILSGSSGFTTDAKGIPLGE